MNATNLNYERFNQLLTQIKLEVEQLKKKNQSLIEENEELKSELEKNRKKSADVFSVIDDSDRIALRQQVDGLIAKIDQHLED